MPATAPSPPPPAVLLCAKTLKYLWKSCGTVIQALQEAGFEVICAGEADDTAAALTAMDCELAPLPWSARDRGTFRDLAVAMRLFGLMRRRRPVVAMGFGSRANVAVAIAARFSATPYVATVGNLGADFSGGTPPAGLLRRLHALTHGAAYASVFNNPGDLALFRRTRISIGRRLLVLPGCGVNLTRFSYAALRRPVTTFLMISRLEREKGVVEYLEAAERLKRERPSLRFLLVGPPGESDGALSVRDVASYGTAVEYLGEVADVRPMLLRSDCLVLPSYREGMPRPVMEAAAMGRLSIVSDVEGCRDAILPDRTGLLCEARSSSSLAEAMRRATRLRLPVVQAMSRQARDLAASRFDEQTPIEAYVSMAVALAGERLREDGARLRDRSGPPMRASAK